MTGLIHNCKELHNRPQSSQAMPLSSKILMVSPDYFNVDNPINPHMLQADGSHHKIDLKKAEKQWKALETTYIKLGLKVTIFDGIQGFPDMVFCANQSFPYIAQDGSHHALLSNMFHETRHGEVRYINQFLCTKNYTTHPLAGRSEGLFFEGMGDALWLPGHRFILAGYGFRSSKNIYNNICEMLKCPIAVFELKHPKFYHLDTCLSVLNSTTALACAEAFTPEGWTLLKSIFDTIIVVPLEEADSPGFACNAHCPDGKHVIIQQGNNKTIQMLQNHHFIPIAVDTSEFIKSGGSVFCMKLMYF